MYRDAEIVLALALAVVPVAFVWVVELMFTITPSAAGVGTTGFFRVDGYQSYHVWMYIMFAVCWTASYRLIERGDD